ncbi:hypothetical protein K432DRAFT_90907 [Lepidopterella palustris CBS 459.81]|uniref:Uncharacterized protein n=1 Tax=Lepidopterella palustris CBS 459.81 TaxID=1314670 RepID=A0A8E2EJX8_9PEZI|nr:hypothetical protein K432DRAFT_90907 [Lepidopterella palustris CBS 459.81]
MHTIFYPIYRPIPPNSYHTACPVCPTHINTLTEPQIYSLMAQNDNAFNIQTAEASLRVAEASQRDSKATKTIAEDSKLVALATSRDSAAMRTIAAVTILFLPATFTATLFSTTFFNFQAPKHERVVSSWVWLYWLVTVLLTIVIHSTRYFTSRRKEQEITRKTLSSGIRSWIRSGTTEWVRRNLGRGFKL